MRAHRVQCGWMVAMFLGFGFIATSAADAPVVNATLAPTQIAMGESAQLTITSSGNGMDPLSMPQVAGLQFRLVGKSNRIEIVNGVTLASSSFIIRVTPEAPGIYTIPGITPKSQPLLLRVNPDNGGNSGAPGGNSYAPGNPGPAGDAGSAATPGALGKPLGGAGGDIRMAAEGAAFIRLILPKRDIYVGESVPVDIEVGARAGFARLNGLPTLNGGEFTLNNLAHQPETSERVIDAKPYSIFTWHTVIAAVKPGKFTLSLEAPFTVRMRTRPQRDSMIDDMLGDPFLQNFFGATVQKDITVSSPASDLTVLALPAEGRPADFSGAVGTFSITGDVSSTKAAAGDPLTLRMHVTGSGNFDRVDSTMLDHLDQWKTYPPKSSFKSGDTLGNKGEKTFEQPLIASKSGVQTIPGLSFSYFNPTTKRYETAHSAPIEVTISPSLADSSLAAPAASAAGNPSAPPATAATPGLRPDQAVSAGAVDTLVPLYLQPRFLGLPAALALAFTGAWLALRRRAAAARRPSKRGLSKALNQLMKDLDAAARAGDAPLFFTRARGALAQHLADRWQIPPDQVTAAEVESRLGGDGDALRDLFTLADEANYSGHGLTMTDFERWTHLVRERLLESTPT